MRQRWKRCLAIFIVTALAAGCTMVFPFEVTGVIKNAVDGSLVAGVLIEPEPGSWLNGDSPVVTRSNGHFSFKFSMNQMDFSKGKLPTSRFKLSKEGFEGETVEITPTRKPQSRTTTQIMLFAFVRPKQLGPQPVSGSVEVPPDKP